MGAETKIQWTRHTFNPWIGCTKVSAGCKNCYAEALDRRIRGVQKPRRWGVGVARERTSDKYWKQPLAWNAQARQAGERHRVFCASLADVFDTEVPEKWREDLFVLINRCEHLDWLLLTKRPENALAYAKGHGLPPNVWLGTSVEDQAAADTRIPLLLQIPARVRFLSMEPLLGFVDLTRVAYTDGGGTHLDVVGGHHGIPGEWYGPGKRVDWVIVGGESGHGARPFNLEWARAIRDQCAPAGVPCFVKQMGSVAMGDELDVDAVNAHRGRNTGCPSGHWRLAFADQKGGDITEWPLDLQVREFPEVRP